MAVEQGTIREDKKNPTLSRRAFLIGGGAAGLAGLASLAANRLGLGGNSGEPQNRTSGVVPQPTETSTGVIPTEKPVITPSPTATHTPESTATFTPTATLEPTTTTSPTEVPPTVTPTEAPLERNPSVADIAPTTTEIDPSLGERPLTPITSITLNSETYPGSEAQNRLDLGVRNFFKHMDVAGDLVRTQGYDGLRNLLISAELLPEPTSEEFLKRTIPVVAFPLDAELTKENSQETEFDPTKGLSIKFVNEPAFIEMTHTSKDNSQASGYTLRVGDEKQLIVEVYVKDGPLTSNPQISAQQKADLYYAGYAHAALESAAYTLGQHGYFVKKPDGSDDTSSSYGTWHGQYFAHNYDGRRQQQKALLPDIADPLMGNKDANGYIGPSIYKVHSPNF